jgi:hypothetical protein
MSKPDTVDQFFLDICISKNVKGLLLISHGNEPGLTKNFQMFDSLEKLITHLKNTIEKDDLEFSSIGAHDIYLSYRDYDRTNQNILLYNTTKQDMENIKNALEQSGLQFEVDEIDLGEEYPKEKESSDEDSDQEYEHRKQMDVKHKCQFIYGEQSKLAGQTCGARIDSDCYGPDSRGCFFCKKHQKAVGKSSKSIK